MKPKKEADRATASEQDFASGPLPKIPADLTTLTQQLHQLAEAPDSALDVKLGKPASELFSGP